MQRNNKPSRNPESSTNNQKPSNNSKIYRMPKDPLASEKFIERYLQDQVGHLGGLALKYFSPFRIGYPDRLVMLPRGHTAWVELKSTGKKPTKLQLLRHAELRSLGQDVYVCDSKESVDALIDKWKKDFELW